MIDPTSFKIRFPEFVSVDDSRIQLFIDDTENVLNPVYWGDKYNLGLYYYTAHLLTIANGSEAGSVTSKGPIASRAVDGTSVSYGNTASGSQADDFLASTIYGQRYLTLRKTLGIPAYVI